VQEIAERVGADTGLEIVDVLQRADALARGAEFERRVQKLARTKKVTCQFVPAKGKGSHGRLYFGEEGSEERNRPGPTGEDVPGSEYRFA